MYWYVALLGCVSHVLVCSVITGTLTVLGGHGMTRLRLTLSSKPGADDADNDEDDSSVSTSKDPDGTVLPFAASGVASGVE